MTSIFQKTEKYRLVFDSVKNALRYSSQTISKKDNFLYYIDHPKLSLAFPADVEIPLKPETKEIKKWNEFDYTPRYSVYSMCTHFLLCVQTIDKTFLHIFKQGNDITRQVAFAHAQQKICAMVAYPCTMIADSRTVIGDFMLYAIHDRNTSEIVYYSEMYNEAGVILTLAERVETETPSCDYLVNFVREKRAKKMVCNTNVFLIQTPDKQASMVMILPFSDTEETVQNKLGIGSDYEITSCTSINTEYQHRSNWQFSRKISEAKIQQEFGSMHKVHDVFANESVSQIIASFMEPICISHADYIQRQTPGRDRRGRWERITEVIFYEFQRIHNFKKPCGWKSEYHKALTDRIICVVHELQFCRAFTQFFNDRELYDTQLKTEIRFSLVHSETVTIFSSLPLRRIILLIAIGGLVLEGRDTCKSIRNELFRALCLQHQSTTFPTITKRIGWKSDGYNTVFVWHDGKGHVLTHFYEIGNEENLLSYGQKMFPTPKPMGVGTNPFCQCTCPAKCCVPHEEIQSALTITSGRPYFGVYNEDCKYVVPWKS